MFVDARECSYLAEAELRHVFEADELPLVCGKAAEQVA